ncbi:MAG: hypothetical protein KAI66_13520 [Lentisphaeria bacterium]|nr:hypothetical protein [Lentisphaeria bacterium]
MFVERRRLTVSQIESTLPPASRWRSFPSSIPSGLNGLLYSPPTGNWLFYGRSRDRSRWVSVTTDVAEVIRSTETEVLRVDTQAAVLEANSTFHWRVFHTGGLTIDVGGRLLFSLSDRSGWDFFWIGGSAASPPTKIYETDVEDGFMRTTFGGDDRWGVFGGNWALKQYGGGMPTTDREAKSASYRRASNAFTLVGNDGEAHYGREDWCNLYMETRFFFGRPDSFSKRDTLVKTVLGGEPVYADKTAIYQSNQIQENPEGSFFICQGLPGRFRVAFGWSMDDRCFQLKRQAPGDLTWNIEKTWKMRPYFTNWVRVGLGLKQGCTAVPYIDGLQLGSYRLPCVVSGPMTLISNGKKVELDDVRIHSYPRSSRLGARIFERSTNFAQKELLAKKDLQTGQWTRAELAFESDEAKVKGRAMHMMRCQFPFYSDFTYRPSPALPIGLYCLAVMKDEKRPYWVGFLRKTAAGWETPDGGTEFELEIGRRKGYIVRKIKGKWEMVTTRRISSTIHLVIGSTQERNLAPDLHLLYSKSLTHDLFEKAPSEWAWHEGNFRMDVRWQCQRGWNFMMGKSRDVATMFSKVEYSGDQEVEFHIALRFVTPPPYYVLRDMGAAICTDGASLGKGYVLIYGDDDNHGTTLLRNGKVVAKAHTRIKHKPGGNIHNYWWHGRLRKRGRTITVELDDQEIIRYRDRQPLDGGHVAFWTQRNAVSLAKVSINAQRRRLRPDRFMTEPKSPTKGVWKPVNVDEVEVKRLGNGKHRVRNLQGGGTFAVRCKLPGNGVSLAGKSRLTLPLKLDDDVKVGIHLQVSGDSYYFPGTAGSSGMQRLLTPAYAKLPAEKIFRSKTFTPAQMKQFELPGRQSTREMTIDLRQIVRKNRKVRLESITVGNSSNEEYRLLGASGNKAGTTMVLGKPRVH